MGKANYTGGFRDGIVIRGVPLQVLHPGKVFWVSNATAAALPGHKGARDAGPGTFNEPFSTIDYAIGQCSSGRGDIIFVKPGYTQTITLATEILLDVAGVAIVGLGVGTARPTITFGTNATANIPISAANVSLYNLLFVANFADVTSAITVSGTALASDFTIQNCEFRDSTSSLNFLSVLTGNATAQNLAGLTFLNNNIVSLGTTAATTALLTGAAQARVRLEGNFGTWAVLNDEPCFLRMGGAHLQFYMVDNVLNKPATESSTEATFVITSGTCTGVAKGNLCWQLDGAAGVWINTGSTLGFIENYSPITGAAEGSGLINPAI